MAYSWTKINTVNTVINKDVINEIKSVADYITNNHCVNNVVNASFNGTVCAHNATVYGSDYGDDSYDSGYKSYDGTDCGADYGSVYSAAKNTNHAAE